MDFSERFAARSIFLTRFAELSGTTFESFFHTLMGFRRPDYVDVRTHGNLGDMAADGLGLHDGKLYACYGPEVLDGSNARTKLEGDLDKALAKREDQFGTFVYVHNDIRGLHPLISEALARGAREHADLQFEMMGQRKIWQEAMRLSRYEIEDLLGAPLAVDDKVYGIGLDDLAPLLQHLSDQRRPADVVPSVREVPFQKLNFNRLDPESQETLITSFRYTYLVDEYYRLRTDVVERDEVAAGFREYYLEVRAAEQDPEIILWELEKYVLGNASPPPPQRWAAWVVLAYFFETCDIFEEPPLGWIPAPSGTLTT